MLAEYVLCSHMKELCVTRDLEKHCEDVRGWRLGYVQQEPDWDFLFGVYKDAEKYIEPWPLRQTRDWVSYLKDTREYLNVYGTDVVVVEIDDGQPHSFLEWVDGHARFTWGVYQGPRRVLRGFPSTKCQSYIVSMSKVFDGRDNFEFLNRFQEEIMDRRWEEAVAKIPSAELLINYLL